MNPAAVSSAVAGTPTQSPWRPWDWSQPLNLPRDEVHVWRAHLQMSREQLQDLHSSLSPDERERAQGYRFLHHRQRFVAARGLLRAILSLYCGLEPGELCFRYNAHGKPQLDPDAVPHQDRQLPADSGAASNGFLGQLTQTHSRQDCTRSVRSENCLAMDLVTADPIHFSLSHSDDLALYAMTRGRRVGVDLELVRPGFAEDTLAESFFSLPEVAALRSLPPGEQQRAFFVCWTRKEAYLKAKGKGLIIPLDSFAVSLAPGEPAALQQTAAEPDERNRWSLRDLDVGPDYVAALVVEGQECQLCYWQWPNTAPP